MVFEIENYKTLRLAMDGLCEFLLAENVPKGSVFDSRLVACELLGNILRHADGRARLFGEIKDGFVELRILSTTIYCPPERKDTSDLYAEHGRGLYIVDKLCEERSHTEGGLTVKIRIKEE